MRTSHALTGGHWVKDSHGVSHWIEHPTRTISRRVRLSGYRDCAGGCGRRVRNATTCSDCRRILDRMPALLVPGRSVCWCGCLLAYAGEDCPSCRAVLLGPARAVAA